MALMQKKPEYRLVQDYFATPMNPAISNQLDIARNEYYKAMYAPTMYDQYGNYDFNKADQTEAAFVSRYGASALKYVEDYQSYTRQGMPAEYEALQQAKQIAQPYWDIEDQIWNKYPTQVRTIADQIGALENGNTADQYRARQMLRVNPIIVRIRSMIAMYRKRMKAANPQLANAIATFY
jgi:hypothetical protein